MRKLIYLILTAAGLAGGGGYFQQHYRVEGLDDFRVVPRAGAERPGKSADRSASRSLPWQDADLPLPDNRETIRIASFNIQVLGATKLGKPHVMDILARTVRQFDVVAIQEVRSRSQDVLPTFVDRINETGRHYDYVIGPRQGRTDSKEQFAFIFDRATIELDRLQTYSVEDPDDLLHRPPLVAAFRVRGPPAADAFTFTLVNVHTDPDEVDAELDLLDDVFRLIQNDGRGEDDIIMLGDFNADDQHLGELGQMTAVTCAILSTPTNTLGTAQYDNLIFCSQATREFTGRCGVFDFMRQYNLTLEQAQEISDHLPVWAEFTVREGGRLGQVASLP
ncbi:MAG: endonuclease/exonuclease/phosphatase family protein [Pirellulaceae bacterium]|nr:endonuclease/exonuclease/phosphatase family protein [Pirellulaceae bacterium]